MKGDSTAKVIYRKDDPFDTTVKFSNGTEVKCKMQINKGCLTIKYKEETVNGGFSLPKDIVKNDGWCSTTLIEKNVARFVKFRITSEPEFYQEGGCIIIEFTVDEFE